MTKMKKLLVALVCCIVLVLAIGITASAYGTTTIYSSRGSAQVPTEQVHAYLNVGWSLNPVKLNNVTPLPVTYSEYGYYSSGYMSLDYFEITDAYYDGYGTIGLYYDMYISGDRISLQMNCLDAYGNVVAQRPVSPDEYYVEVPSSTVSFKLVPMYGGTGEYVHCVQIDMYAMDGRHIWMYDLQAPVYESVGWYRATTLYAMDGRTIEVPPYQVAAYQSVGWYTEADFYYNFIANNYYSFMAVGDYGSARNILWEHYYHCYDFYPYAIDEMFYNALKPEFDRYYYAGDYEGALDLLDEDGGFLSETAFEYSVAQLRCQAKDKWRNKLQCPIVVSDYEIYDGDYYPELDLEIRNLSYKPVRAFKLQFTCYDVFGTALYDSYEYYYAEDAELGVDECWTYNWDLDGVNSSVDYIGNIKVTQVVFEDRTQW